MQILWQGYYLDGITAARQPVAITLTPAGLHIAKTNGVAFLWPYAETTQTQGFYAGEPVRLEKGDEALVISDTAFLQAMRLMAPTSSGKFHNSASGKKRFKWVVLGAIATLAGLTAAYLWAIPAGARTLAEYVPPAWEAKLGETVVKQFTTGELVCGETLPQQAVDSIMQILNSAAPKHPYKFHVYIVKDETVNALAAPGGHLIIFTGLLEQTKNAEELAGVLAHEMQHVLNKHATKAIFQNLSITAILTIMLGDSGIIGDMVSSMGGLRYSRMQEEEADKIGMDIMIKAGVNPNGMIDFFNTLGKKYGDEPGLFKYISTHPLMADRIKKLKARAEWAPFDQRPLLPDISWPQVVKSC